MSHFTVLVIGEDIEAQLAPYHEFECTGLNDQYVQEIDITAEIKKRIAEEGETLNDTLEYHGLGNRTVRDEADIDRDGKHKFGYALIDGKSELVKAVNRTNPNRKWDWWQVGGRWTGFFKLKAGVPTVTGEPGMMTPEAGEGYGDSALKEEIDFDGMRQAAGDKAANQYDLAMIIFKDAPPNESWDSIRARHEDAKTSPDAARDEYWSQPRCAAWKKESVRDFKNFPFGFFASPDEFLCPKEEYVQKARDEAIQTFAVVKDGKWYERGQMGWWACVSNEKDPETWTAQFTNLLDQLPPDTRLTVVDCHI